MNPCTIGVVGAGVIGLTNALHLQNQGYQVTLISKAFPHRDQSHLQQDPYYTSSRSGAHWFSFAGEDETAQQADDALTFYALQGLSVLYPNAAQGQEPHADSGISRVRGHAVFEEKFYSPSVKPWWHRMVPQFHEYTPEDLDTLNARTGKQYVYGFHYETVMVNVRKYLPFLLDAFVEKGGKIRVQTVERLDSGFGEWEEFDILLNCTGLAARKLANDPAVYACRGRTILVFQPKITEIWREKTENPVYILPRGDGTVVLGGTYEDHNYSLETSDTHIEQQILDKCTQLQPILRDPTTRILGQSCGLRPGRQGGPRLEWHENPDNPNGPTRLLLHCYGHHGFGVQCSWGVAHRVAQTIQEKLVENNAPHANNPHLHSKL